MHNHELKSYQYHYCPTIDTALTLNRAKNGDNNAQFDMSLLLEAGHGCEVDLEQSFMWCEKAALDSHPIAQYYLSDKYLNGIGVQTDIYMAHVFVEASANQDYPEALYVLALMYNHGEYVEENQEISEKLIKRAAMLGHTEAQEIVKDIDCNFGHSNDVPPYLDSSLLYWNFEDIILTRH